MQIFMLSMIALFVYFPVRGVLFGDGPVFGDSVYWFFSDIICLMLIAGIVIAVQFFRFPLRTFGRVFQFWVVESVEGRSQDVHAYLTSSITLTMIVSMLLSGVVLILEHHALIEWTHVEHPALFVICCGLLTAVLQFMIPLSQLRRQIRKEKKGDVSAAG